LASCYEDFTDCDQRNPVSAVYRDLPEDDQDEVQRAAQRETDDGRRNLCRGEEVSVRGTIAGRTSWEDDMDFFIETRSSAASSSRLPLAAMRLPGINSCGVKQESGELSLICSHRLSSLCVGDGRTFMCSCVSNNVQR